MQKIKCSEPGCPEYIEFKPDPVRNLAEAEINLEEAERTAYLTCDLGHTHAYRVRV